MRTTDTLRGVPGILTEEQVAASGAYLARLQLASGLVPWFTGGHADPWNHVECAMALTVTPFTSTLNWRYGREAPGLRTLANPTISSTGFRVYLMPHRPLASLFPRYLTAKVAGRRTVSWDDSSEGELDILLLSLTSPCFEINKSLYFFFISFEIS